MSPTYVAFLIAAATVGFTVLLAVVIAHLSGWASLAERYRCLEPFPESSWKLQSGQFRWYLNYNNCLTVGADPRGLFLWIFPLFRAAHPPLFIPWNEISISRQKVLWVKQVRFCLGHELQIPFTIREGLAQKLRSAAGSSWPVEVVPGG